MTDEQSHWAVTMAERYADGEASEQERAEAFRASHDLDWTITREEGDGDTAREMANCAALSAANENADFRPCDGADFTAAEDALHCAAAATEYLIPPDSHSTRASLHKAQQTARLQECVAQAQLVRCIFGNPFRLPRLIKCWQTVDVLGLAQSIYLGKKFENMPLLSDALQDAGCADPEILAHCQETDGHIRGCWVLDLLLGKE